MLVLLSCFFILIHWWLCIALADCSSVYEGAYDNEYPDYQCRLSIWGAYGDQTLVDDMSYYDMWTGTYLDISQSVFLAHWSGY